MTLWRWWSRHHSRFQRKLSRSSLARALKQGVSGDGRRCNQPDYATFSREIRGRNALQRVSPANFPGKRSIIWLLQTKRVATPAVCRNRRCNAFRLNQPNYATFSREIRGRNALQRVSVANFPGKRSIIWLRFRRNALQRFPSAETHWLDHSHSEFGSSAREREREKER